MSDRSATHHRTTRRAHERATVRAIRRGTLDAIAGAALCPSGIARGLY
jgi:hypothetical protein